LGEADEDSTKKPGADPSDRTFDLANPSDYVVTINREILQLLLANR
jgi:hypothetical protein